MQKLHPLLWIPVVLLCSGCLIARDVTRTMVVEPATYPTHVQEVAICSHAHKLAEIAWQEEFGAVTKRRNDFDKGFVAGYADHVQFGGNGEPPPLPPRCYWAKGTPEGRQQAFDWFTGFRRGAAAAIQSGARDLILVPASGPGHIDPEYASGRPVGGSSPPVVLPMPKAADPTD